MPHWEAFTEARSAYFVVTHQSWKVESNLCKTLVLDSLHAIKKLQLKCFSRARVEGRATYFMSEYTFSFWYCRFYH